MIYYENIIFYRDSSHNAVLFIIDSPTLFRDKKIHINNDFIVLFRPPSDGGLMIPPWTKNDVW